MCNWSDLFFLTKIRMTYFYSGYIIISSLLVPSTFPLPPITFLPYLFELVDAPCPHIWLLPQRDEHVLALVIQLHDLHPHGQAAGDVIPPSNGGQAITRHQKHYWSETWWTSFLHITHKITLPWTLISNTDEDSWIWIEMFALLTVHMYVHPSQVSASKVPAWHTNHAINNHTEVFKTRWMTVCRVQSNHMLTSRQLRWWRVQIRYCGEGEVLTMHRTWTLVCLIML